MPIPVKAPSFGSAGRLTAVQGERPGPEGPTARVCMSVMESSYARRLRRSSAAQPRASSESVAGSGTAVGAAGHPKEKLFDQTT